MDAEHHILCLGARTQLDPDTGRELCERLAGRVDWDSLWEQAHLHEVIPLLGASFRQVPAPIVPDGWLRRAERRTRATLLQNLVLAEELVRVLRSFTEAHVTVVPVKGIVLAETVYGSLALRPAADIDVLVPPAEIDRARGLLAGLGYVQSDAPPFEAAHHPFHDAQYFLDTDAGTVCLELHAALWNPRFHRPDQGLFDRLVPGELRGVSVSLLSPEDTLLHLAVHRVRSPLRLRFLCDVAEAVRRHGAALDWAGLVHRAAALEARTALSTALRLSRDLLGAPVPAQTIEGLRVGPLKRRLLDHTCGVEALFRRAAPGDATQQPSLALRAFEQDGAARISSTLIAAVARKLEKRRYARERVGTGSSGRAAL